MPIASVRINPPQMRTVFGVRQEKVVIESRQGEARLRSRSATQWPNKRECRNSVGALLDIISNAAIPHGAESFFQGAGETLRVHQGRSFQPRAERPPQRPA